MAAIPNAYLLFAGEQFPLFVTSFGYSLQTEHKGDSQARQGYTLYPYRVVRSDIAVRARFRSISDYKKFGTFIAKYHQSLTNGSGSVMHFISPKKTTGGVGISPSKNINYCVTIEKFPMVIAYDMDAAPETAFTMRILSDEYMGLTTASKMTGKVTDLIGEDIIKSGAVVARGDNAFNIYVNPHDSKTNSILDEKKKSAHRK